MAKDNNTLLILAGVGVVGLIVYSMMNKSQQSGGSAVNNNAGTTNYAAGSAQNISAFGNLFSGLGSGFASIWTATQPKNAAAGAISGSGSTSNTA